MLAVERRTRILDILRINGVIKVVDLSADFGVSEETIRRDLHRLEKDGHLVRTYGGAYLSNEGHTEIPIETRETLYVESKRNIAAVCADMINAGETIMLGSSTTALHVAELIRSKENIVVITNAIKVVMTLADAPGVRVISCGGTLNRSTLSFTGHRARKFLSGYYADKAFVSCTGVDINRGMTGCNEAEADLRRLMLDQAQQRILIADQTKFGKVSFALIGDLDRLDYVVSDVDLDEEWQAAFERHHITHLVGGHPPVASHKEDIQHAT